MLVRRLEIMETIARHCETSSGLPGQARSSPGLIFFNRLICVSIKLSICEDHMLLLGETLQNISWRNYRTRYWRGGEERENNFQIWTRPVLPGLAQPGPTLFLFNQSRSWKLGEKYSDTWVHISLFTSSCTIKRVAPSRSCVSFFFIWMSIPRSTHATRSIFSVEDEDVIAGWVAYQDEQSSYTTTVLSRLSSSWPSTWRCQRVG